jgi:hypothetical protein
VLALASELVLVVARMRRVLAIEFSQSRLDEHREAVEKGAASNCHRQGVLAPG